MPWPSSALPVNTVMPSASMRSQSIEHWISALVETARQFRGATSPAPECVPIGWMGKRRHECAAGHNRVLPYQ